MSKKKFKNYKDCITYLFNLERAGIKYDLKNIRRSLKLLNNPQHSFKSIHVAGTNGKGSVSSIINSVLIEKGFKIGLYTSPHINDFRERILVDGKFISKKFILEFINLFYNEIQRIKPSFFEVTTAMAFEYFKQRKVDYAIIETGLGGRLDSTNVLKPHLCIITSLSVDHIDFLGDSIESITREKGGIIKRGKPVIAGNISKVSASILKKIANEKKSEIIFAGKRDGITIIKKTETGFYFNGGKFTKLFFPIIGDYQINNIKTALAAVDIISKADQINFSHTVMKKAFKNLKTNSNLYGRFELISKNPKVIIDISHNEQAIKNIRSNLKYFKYEQLIVIFAMMEDKKYRNCIQELEKLDAKIILTKPDYKRAANPKLLYDAVKKNKTMFDVRNNLKAAIEYAEESAKQNDLILITGSFFLVSDFLALFNKYK